MERNMYIEGSEVVLKQVHEIVYLKSIRKSPRLT